MTASVSRNADAETARCAVIGRHSRKTDQHGVDIAPEQRQIGNLRGVDHIGDRRVERASLPLRINFEGNQNGWCRRPGPKKVTMVLLPGREYAILTGFPDVAQ